MRVNHTGNNPVQSAETRSAKQTHKKGTTQGVHGAHHAHSAKHARSTEGAAADGVKASISSKARDQARAREIASRTPDVREDRIAELKQRIAQGRYHIDADAIADRMVDEHLRSGSR